MTYINGQGQKAYCNPVQKRGKLQFVVKAASGQAITGRDRQKRASRTFTHQHQAEAWLVRNGYASIG